MKLEYPFKYLCPSTPRDSHLGFAVFLQLLIPCQSHEYVLESDITDHLRDRLWELVKA